MPSLVSSKKCPSMSKSVHISDRSDRYGEWSYSFTPAVVHIEYMFVYINARQSIAEQAASEVNQSGVEVPSLSLSPTVI